MLKNNITNKNENKVLGFFSDDEKLFPVIQLKAKKKNYENSKQNVYNYFGKNCVDCM